MKFEVIFSSDQDLNVDSSLDSKRNLKTCI